MALRKQNFIFFRATLIFFSVFIIPLVLYSFQYSNSSFCSKAASLIDLKELDSVSKIWDRRTKSDFFFKNRENRNTHVKENVGSSRTVRKYTKLEDQTLDVVITLLRLVSQVMKKNKEKNTLKNKEKDLSFDDFFLKKGSKINFWLQDSHIIEETLLKAEKIRENAECAKLILCKTQLFVKGMQKSLIFFTPPNAEHHKRKGEYERKVKSEEYKKAEKEVWLKSSPDEKFYFFLPTLERFVESGDACDLRFPLCFY